MQANPLRLFRPSRYSFWPNLMRLLTICVGAAFAPARKICVGAGFIPARVGCHLSSQGQCCAVSRTPPRFTFALLLFLATALVLLAPQFSWAKTTPFGNRDRQLKVCNLVLTSASTSDNPDPHLWYIADTNAWLPPSWELTNPNGPPELTNSALDRWDRKYTAAGTPFPPGIVRLDKSYAPFWEVISDLPQLERLKDYDLILIHNHTSNTLSPAEVQLLNLLADSGVTILIVGGEDTTAATLTTLSWPGASPLFDLHGAPMFQSGTFANTTATPTPPVFLPPSNPHHRHLSYPYSLDLSEILALAAPPPSTWRRVVTNVPSSLESLLTDTASETFLAASRYGSGQVAVSSLDIASKINSSLRGGPDLTAGKNDGIISGTEYTRPPADPQRLGWDGDFKLLLNLLDGGSEWPSFGANPRRLQSHTDFPGAVLGEEWNYSTSLASAPSAVPDSNLPLIPSPIVANGVVFAASPSGLLYAFDLFPSRDLDGDGNPDDGFQDTSPTSGYDLIWSADVGEPVAATPAIAHVNWVDGSSVAHSDDIIIVATLSGHVYAYDLLPRNPDGTLASPGSPGWPGSPAWSYNGLAQIRSSVSVVRGLAYVTDQAGKVAALDLSLSMAAGALGGPAVEFISGNLPASGAGVTGTGALALVRDELTGASDETCYVPCTSVTGGTINAVVSYTSGEKLILRDQTAGIWDIWASQRTTFCADPTSVRISLNGVLLAAGTGYTVLSLGTEPLRIRFLSPPLPALPAATATVQASYKVIPNVVTADKWTSYLTLFLSPIYSSPAVGSGSNLYFAAGYPTDGLYHLYGLKDHGYYQGVGLGRPPGSLFDISLPTGWGAVASPAVGEDTVVFGLGNPSTNEGMAVGLATDPDFTLRLGHSRIVVDSAFSVSDFNAPLAVPLPTSPPLTNPDWWMKPYDSALAPNGYGLNAESGIINFKQRDAGKRVVITYHYTDPATGQAASELVTEYHTIPRLVKWQFPSVGVQLPVGTFPIPADARVLVTLATGSYNDSVVQPLWIDRPAGFIHLPFPFLGASVNVLVQLASGLVYNYPTVAGLPRITIGRVIASPIIAGNSVFVDAITTSASPAERDVFCLELDPAEGTELDLDTYSAWGTSFRAFQYSDDMAVDPDNLLGNGNGAYDLLGVSRSSSLPDYVASPALAQDRLVLASCRNLGTQTSPDWYWSLSALDGELGYLGDGGRLLQLRRDGSAQAEWQSTVQRTTLNPDPLVRTIRTDRQPFADPVSAQPLAPLGRRGNLLVADTQNHRLLEMDATGKILWRLDRAFGDAFTDALALLPRGDLLTLSRPRAALRREVPDTTNPGDLRADVTFVADSGRHRALAIQNHFDPATDQRFSYRTSLTSAANPADVTLSVSDASAFPTQGVVTVDQEQIAYSSRTDNAFPTPDTLNGLTWGFNGTAPALHLAGAWVIYPSPELLWRTDPTQTVYQAADRGGGGEVILNSTTNLPSFHRQKVAADYQPVSVCPVTLSQPAPPFPSGQPNPLGIRWNYTDGKSEFDYVLLAINDYALDRFPDQYLRNSDGYERFQTLESGPGASVAFAWGPNPVLWDPEAAAGAGGWVPVPAKAGQVFAAFSGFYLDPADANGSDPNDNTKTKVKWGRPYDRVFTQIQSVELSKVTEAYPAAGWATFYLTVAGTVARNPFDPAIEAPTPPFGPGIYPVTLMIYFGQPPSNAADYNSSTNLLRFHGRPYLSVTPDAVPYAAGPQISGRPMFGLPTWFDQAKYATYMAAFAGLASSSPVYLSIYPVQYTGTSSGFYAYFLPSSASLSPNGRTYAIVNSHDAKSEVFEWDTAAEASAAPPEMAMKNICPRPQTYSSGHPQFFGGASGLTNPSVLGRDF